METYLIANPKGGVGKSTLAINLAGGLAGSAPRRVMLGDIDRQQSARAWLQLRPTGMPAVASWDIQPEAPARPPQDTTHVVLDSPAGLHGKKLAQVLKMVARVIVPLTPSLFDIMATRHFLDELLEARAARRAPLEIGIVGMRVDAHTRAAAELERFLAGTGLPVLAYLRDTQNYVQATAHGLTVFELSAGRAARDWEQWQPLLRWASQ